MKSPLFLQRIFVVGILCAGAMDSRAETTNQSADLPLKQIGPGIFQLGSVRLDKSRKTIQFPATVNMTNGLVEYFVVNGTGKLHESILKTETEPSQIHIAMLFIGANVATNVGGTNIVGDKFTMEVSWKNAESEKRIPAEDLILNGQSKLPMSKEGWIYNGSKVIDGTFIAQRDGSIVSIISDALALANSRQTERDNDEIWFVNTNLVPELNTTVEVTFKLEQPQKTTKDIK
jgi:hypothetical protein